MRLTRAGLGLVGVAAITLAIALLFGLLELFQLLAVIIAVLVIAVVFVLIRQPKVRVLRATQPTTLRSGEPAQLVLTVKNEKQGKTPVLFAKDVIAGTQSTRLTFGSIEQDQQIRVGYSVPATARGLLEVGPLQIDLQDPLGLVKRRLEGAPIQSFLVRPRLLSMPAIKASAGTLRHHATTAKSNRTGSDEFYALRPYVLGDDLRRVHWKSAARTQNLLVRQDRDAQLGGVTIVCDISVANYTPEGFERAIVAANSIAHAAYAGGDLTQIYLTDSLTPVKLDSAESLDLFEEQLALITPSTNTAPDTILEKLSQRSIGGTLVFILGQTNDMLANQFAKCKIRHQTAVAISCDGSPSTNAVGTSNQMGPAWAISYTGEQVTTSNDAGQISGNQLSAVWQRALAVQK